MDDTRTIEINRVAAKAAGDALAREAARLRKLRSGGEKARWREYEAAILESVAAALGYSDDGDGDGDSDGDS